MLMCIFKYICRYLFLHMVDVHMLYKTDYMLYKT